MLKLKKKAFYPLFALSLFFFKISSVFADVDLFECGNGSPLKFHSIDSKHTGYWSTSTWNHIPLESEDMMMSDQFHLDNFSFKSRSGYILDHMFVTCYYQLHDNLTGTEVEIKLSSIKHH